MASHTNSKKRKRANVVLHQDPAPASSDGADTTKPTAVYKPRRGRSHTLSIALPGSIIANAQSHDLKTAMAGAIARAAAVFSVDEIVIFNDGQSQRHDKGRRDNYRHYNDAETGYTGFSDPDNFIYHVLSYLETPPNLRKVLFPLHPNLRTAGTLPSLDMPHHLRADEWCQYREGVVLDAAEYGGYNNHAPPTPQSSSSSKKKKSKKGQANAADTTAGAPAPTTYVEAGLPYPVPISATIPAHTRVTLKFAATEDPGAYEELEASAVGPAAPREEAGYFWGYQTRQADSLSAVFTECPFDGGYDLSVGTSERGTTLAQILAPRKKKGEDEDGDGTPRLPDRFEHLLLVFGGVAGLEVAANADPELREKGVTGANVGDMFDAWVNLVPDQGSRTIRCEEAVWLGLMGLRDYVSRCGGEGE
ncbi:uncharacterized protein K452DRAFT_348788 [Aplosporella prunicola CBS 121167]|uniref:DUF171-domain-containing protein n=1 Tax=Aplosporella prunicola CBS 121167 TaxID=1176127 RepID=A0A6A6BSJ0_9PEZI|nr:uncharacterized protein K452DRAFT_348788 [Aplosporella prunicola CBS 121167]KAF2146204.1 hypothetical protein K452DRAFT_348788 [Aplosporella prunicola CBS 121167]